jgi:hypothetical protein
LLAGRTIGGRNELGTMESDGGLRTGASRLRLPGGRLDDDDADEPGRWIGRRGGSM